MGLRKKIKSFTANYAYIKNIKKEVIENKNIVITGTNSGIGLELVKALSKYNNKIYAIYRKENQNLAEVQSKNIIPIKCDFSIESDLNNLKKNLINLEIDILINNAATFGPIDEQDLINLNFEEFTKAVIINSFSVLRIVKIILEKKEKTLKQIINISSEMGSINNNLSGGSYIYRTTKAAMNCISKNLYIDLKNDKISVIALHPGNVKTKFNSSGLIDPKKCAEKMINFIANNNQKFNGKFVNLNNLQIIDW